MKSRSRKIWCKCIIYFRNLTDTATILLPRRISWHVVYFAEFWDCMPPSHYVNQYWLTIDEILWHSFLGNVYLNTQYINLQVEFEIYTFEITNIFRKGQWFNSIYWSFCLRDYLLSTCVRSELTNIDAWRTLHCSEHDVVPNHRHSDCLLNRLFRHRSKTTSMLRVTGLCEGEFTGDRRIPRT